MMEEAKQNLCLRVRQSAEIIMNYASHVILNESKLKEFCQSLDILNYTTWSECHFDHSKQSLESLLSFIFVIDSLNFCFWPTPGFQYDNLTENLKKQLDIFPDFYSADYLAKELTVQDLKQRVFNNSEFCLLEERTAILKNLGDSLISNFGGKYTEFLKAANNSAVKVRQKINLQLVSLIYKHLEGFRDSYIVPQEAGYPAALEGKQIFFLKRAQILTADIYAALSERKDQFPSLFPDINELTMFPDYRVPQILQAEGILQYSDQLKQKIELKDEISPRSMTEAEIRASTIVAVERMKEELAKRNLKYNSIQLDWYLWQRGEKLKDEILTHHRTLTKFY